MIFALSPVTYLSDSRYSMLTAQSLVRYHTPDLSHYKIPDFDADVPFYTIRGAHAYQLQRTNGRLLYGFPHGTSFLSAPFVAMLGVFGISPSTADNHFDLDGELQIQRLLAAALMAIFVVLTFRMAMLWLDWKWSTAIAVAGGLGTGVWSTASRATWGHTWQITLAMVVIYLLATSFLRNVSTRPALLATLLAWMFFVRPTGAIAVVVVGGYVLLYRRSDVMVFGAIGLAWLLAWIAYTWRIFGTLVPFYYGAQAWSLGGMPAAVFGNIFQLFLFSPIFAVALYWVIRYWNGIPARRLAILSILATGGIMLSVSAHADWWGGLSYGPRYMTDALPWLILLAILGIAAIPTQRRSALTPSVWIAALALVLSISINCVGAWSWTAADWRYRPHQVRLDWRELQFLSPWIHPLPSEQPPPP